MPGLVQGIKIQSGSIHPVSPPASPEGEAVGGQAVSSISPRRRLYEPEARIRSAPKVRYVYDVRYS